MSIKTFKKKISSPILWINFMLMFFVLIGVGIGVWYWLKDYTLHGQEITVPSVKGQRIGQVGLTLSRLRLKAVVVDSGYNRSLPTGTILEQNPASGQKVKPGREIYLTINTHKTPTIPFPDIADNCSAREAEARLKALGFTIIKHESVEGEKDWVYGVKCKGRIIQAGERISKEEPIVLQVGQSSSNTAIKEDIADPETSINSSTTFSSDGNDEEDVYDL